MCWHYWGWQQRAIKSHDPTTKRGTFFVSSDIRSFILTWILNMKYLWLEGISGGIRYFRYNAKSIFIFMRMSLLYISKGKFMINCLWNYCWWHHEALFRYFYESVIRIVLILSEKAILNSKRKTVFLRRLCMPSIINNDLTKTKRRYVVRVIFIAKQMSNTCEVKDLHFKNLKKLSIEVIDVYRDVCFEREFTSSMHLFPSLFFWKSITMNWSTIKIC